MLKLNITEGKNAHRTYFADILTSYRQSHMIFNFKQTTKETEE